MSDLTLRGLADHAITVTCIEEVVSPPSRNDFIFATYSWLSNLVSPATCNSETITIYKYQGYTYLYIETATGAAVYNANGQLYCTSSPGFNCLDFYTIDEQLEVWTCNGGGGPTVVDVDMDGVLSDVDPNDNDACIPNAVGPNCVVIVDNDNDGVYSDVDPDDSNPCIPNVVGPACAPTGGVPAIFTDYSFLSNFVDYNNCTTEKITAYMSNGYPYVYVETPASSVLYNGNGANHSSCCGDWRTSVVLRY